MQDEVSEDYSIVIIATMAINTNDCFTALNGVRLDQFESKRIDEYRHLAIPYIKIV
jgi:hypothetical protein